MAADTAEAEPRQNGRTTAETTADTRQSGRKVADETAETWQKRGRTIEHRWTNGRINGRRPFILPFICRSSDILPLFCRCSASSLPLFCRNSAACTRSAAILALFCRDSPAILPLCAFFCVVFCVCARPPPPSRLIHLPRRRPAARSRHHGTLRHVAAHWATRMDARVVGWNAGGTREDAVGSGVDGGAIACTRHAPSRPAATGRVPRGYPAGIRRAPDPPRCDVSAEPCGCAAWRSMAWHGVEAGKEPSAERARGGGTRRPPTAVAGAGAVGGSATARCGWGRSVSACCSAVMGGWSG